MIKKYELEDFKELSSWFDKHEIFKSEEKEFPSTGFIIKGIAAGFLYTTNGDYCILENFVSNPDASPQDRGIALTEITENLIELAKSLKYSYIIAITKVGSIKLRAINNEFKSLGNYEVFMREM